MIGMDDSPRNTWPERYAAAIAPRSPALRGAGRAAVVVSALLFTVHHVVALLVMGDVRLLLLGSAGVFLGGLIWSACYLKYESVWPGYVSHIFADLAIMAIGWRILFG